MLNRRTFWQIWDAIQAISAALWGHAHLRGYQAGPCVYCECLGLIHAAANAALMAHAGKGR